MKTIKDPIHGSLQLKNHEIQVLDTYEMQRLRNIKQLGFTYFVYPSATHTRFEHSLGTFYLASKLAGNLELNDSETDKLRLAALLHDVGHGPFSHGSEEALKLHNPEVARHEENTVELVKKSKISDILKENGFKPKEIAEIATGKKGVLSDIISGQIDVDRMDYLVRDSYYTGAAYGVIDLERLLETLSIRKRKLAVEPDGLFSAEALLLARYLMYPTVYQHHTGRIIHSMYSEAISECLEDGIFTVSELYEMDDISAVSTIRKLETFPGDLMNRIEKRDLYKSAATFKKSDLNDPDKLLNLSPSKLKALQIEISESADLKKGDVLLDVPKSFLSEVAGMKVYKDKKLRELQEVSPLAESLIEAQWTQWYAGVYCSKENVEKVKKSAENILPAF
ncbi:MAG: HD domain-containing protein [Candidatus Undinarchaeales archaeon]